MAPCNGSAEGAAAMNSRNPAHTRKANVNKVAATPAAASRPRAPIVPAIPLPMMHRRPISKAALAVTSPPIPAPQPGPTANAAQATPPTTSPGPATPATLTPATERQTTAFSTPPDISSSSEQGIADSVKPVGPAARCSPVAVNGTTSGGKNTGEVAPAVPPEAMSQRPASGVSSLPTQAPMPMRAHDMQPPIMLREPLPDSAFLSQQPYHAGYLPTHPHRHQPHPSNGSIMFGAMHGSSHTSPAPHSGGMFPPPGIVAPYPPEFGPPVSGFDEYAPLPMASAPLEPHSGMPSYSPPTPRSFHGSQASIQIEEPGFTKRQMENGGDEHDQIKYRGQMPFNELGHPPAPGHFPPLEIRNQESLVADIQRAFADPAYADCELNVFLADPPASQDHGATDPRSATHRPSTSSHKPGYRMPVIVPSHRLILARSPLLRDIIRGHGIPDGKVRLFSDDPFIGPEAVWAVMEYLYGRPVHIVPETLPSDAPESEVKHAFGLALAFTAVGHLLRLDDVVFQGVRDACRLIGWSTIETAFEFSLTGASYLHSPMQHANHPLSPHPEAQYQHGPIIRHLVADAMRFVFDHFPHNFALDVNAQDPKYGRLPLATSSRSLHNGPTIVDGRSGRTSQARLPHNARLSSDPRLSKIKFGDLSPPSSNGNSSPTAGSLNSALHSREGSASVRASDAILSRILLNLPFDFLRYILENQGLGSSTGWMPVHVRHKIMLDVITERESRRFQAIEAVRAGRVPNSQAIRRRLESSDPQVIGDIWDVLGWQEEIVASAQDGPRIVRMWVPLASQSIENGNS